MAEIAAEEVDRWPVGCTFAVRPSMQRITLEVILRAVFGIDDPARLERLRGLLTEMMEQNPVYLWFEWMRVDLGARSPFGRYLRLRDRVDAILFDEIAARRRNGFAEERVDVLSLLAQSGLSDGELRDELMTLLLAGHETTATGLAWACERLVRHPEALARAREDDAYLEATVKQVAGFDLDAGTMVVPAITTVQRAEKVWSDAGAFSPERFLDGESGPAYGWIPFGGGVRRCIGAAFAQLEMKVVLRTVLERAELAPPPGRGPEAQRLRHVTLVPARGGEVLVPAKRAGRIAHADEARGDAADDRVLGDVPGHDGVRAEDAVVPDAHPA
jgi:cytochrome P450